MASWHDVHSAAPDLAHRVQTRFELDGHAVLATLRRDGSPRLTGIEMSFVLGELWLGMMPDSLKALDLVRDRRCALHSTTHGKNVIDGDAKLGAQAVLESDPTRIQAYVMAASVPEGLPLTLFRLEVEDLSFLEPAGDHLVITSWRPGEAVREQKRY
jgi:hypothetical protein